MPTRIVPRVLVILMPAPSSLAQPPRVIPRDRARQRAGQIPDVRYRLAFTFSPKVATTAGEEELRFTLKTLQPVFLDFRDGRLLSASVNGADLGRTQQPAIAKIEEHGLKRFQDRKSTRLNSSHT